MIKHAIFVFTTATPIINQGKWTCDQQQQKLIGVLTFEETELERATRLLVLTWSYSGDFYEYKSYFVSYLEGCVVAALTLVTFPVWPGYWHDFGPRQNLPSKCLCLGQMVIPSSWILDKCWIPALAMINLASVTSLHFDKWQLAKWADISALHSESKTCSTSSLLEPHGLWSIS